MKKAVIPTISFLLFSAYFFTYAQSGNDASIRAMNNPDTDDQVTIINRGNVQLKEYRVGGRLEEVTVQREEGLEEVYQNHRPDTQWAPAESELGEKQNIRKWKVFEW